MKEVKRKSTDIIHMGDLRVGGASYNTLVKFKSYFPKGASYADIIDKLARMKYIPFMNHIMEALGPAKDTRVYKEDIIDENRVIAFPGNIEFEMPVIVKRVIAGGEISGDSYMKVDSVSSWSNVTAAFGLSCEYLICRGDFSSSKLHCRVSADISGDVSVTDLSIGNELKCEGNVHVNAEMHCRGYVYVDGNITVKGPMECDRTVRCGGDLEVGELLISRQNLVVFGNITCGKNILCNESILCGEKIKVRTGYGIFAGLNYSAMERRERIAITSKTQPLYVELGDWHPRFNSDNDLVNKFWEEISKREKEESNEIN